MAKKSMIAREKRRKLLIAKFSEQRRELKEIIKKSDDFDQITNAQIKLDSLPVDSSPVRSNSRCGQCGRPRSVYRKFGLCRLCLRKQLMVGNVAGGRMSSW